MPPPIGSVLDIGPMYATVRRQTDRQTSDAHHRLMPPTWRGIKYHTSTLDIAQHRKRFSTVVNCIAVAIF